MILGQLDVFGWKGWRLVYGVLIGPDGWQFMPGEILALPLLRAQLSALQVTERQFRATEPQPEPVDDAGELLARINGGCA